MKKIYNQFIIYISPNVEWGNYDRVIEASKKNTSSGFKLYLFFTSHLPDSEVYFYPSSFCEEFGVSMSSEKRGFQELITNGYLTQKSEEYFIFCDVAQKE